MRCKNFSARIVNGAPFCFDARMAANLSAIVGECQKLLRPEEYTDSDRAHNGLQVENSGAVTRIAATVDASLATVKLAVTARADLLIVHHGLFWNSTVPWTGKRRELIETLVKNNVAVYSSHLPLDGHKTLGNNAQICAALGFKSLKSFFFLRNQFIGWQARQKISRTELSGRLARILGAKPLLLPGGPDMCERIGVCSGGAGEDLKIAKKEGVDTFITGEGPHWTHAMAEDEGINVFYGGHYATETFGVKALAAHLSRKFRLPWSFLDHPSGL